MLHALYRQIVDAVSPKAPLLARELNITCKQNTGQVDPFDELFDGCTAWNKVADMGMTISHDENEWLHLVTRDSCGIVGSDTRLCTSLFDYSKR